MTSFAPRELSAEERGVVEFLLEPAFPGVEELRAQLGHLRVVALSAREGLTRLQFARAADEPRAAVHSELPVETQVCDAWPPRKVCLYVDDGLLDALEVGDFGGAVVQELPAVATLEPPWCHRPAAPFPRAACTALSRTLTRIAPRGTKVTVSPTEDGCFAEVRHGHLGMSKAGMGSLNDDERRSVVQILAFVQERIAAHTAKAWPATTELHEPRPERPFAPPPRDMEARRRFIDEHTTWRRRLPSPGASVTPEGIRAWYGPPDDPVVQFVLPTPSS
ncbi:MAG TPA: hypothetical protein VFW14_19330 [Gaiellales bacterium]|nr:hypothetical protein [Gaiellales bacterium]